MSMPVKMLELDRNRYMEHHLFLRNTGVRNFCDQNDTISTYLPLFPPFREKRME
jgi:hypothetical protein